MCLAIPGQITELLSDSQNAGHQSLAMVDILGVRRKVSVDLLQDDPPSPGDWVLVHVGFAMSKISCQRAAEQLEMLSMLGEASTARQELEIEAELGMPNDEKRMSNGRPSPGKAD